MSTSGLSSVLCPPSSASSGLPLMVGFCGVATAGKTSAARVLVTRYDYHRISFADPIRQMLLALGLSATDLSRDKEIPHALLGGKTPRQAMQTLGTEWGRNAIDPELWLRAARHRALNIIDTVGRVVFDDVRFDNEAAMIRHLGGLVIRIVRTDQAPLIAASGHSSEAGVSLEHVSATLHASDLLSLEHVVTSHFNALAA